MLTYRLIGLVFCLSSSNCTVQNGSCFPNRDLLGRLRCSAINVLRELSIVVTHRFSHYYDESPELLGILSHTADKVSWPPVLKWSCGLWG